MTTISAEQTLQLDAWWRAANYLSVGQIYLRDNALLREPLRAEHIKPRLLGHFGTVPGLNLVYAHANRAIAERDLSALYIAGPGHGGPGMVANAWLDGTYSELFPDITTDAAGITKLFRQFSTPGGIPSHAAPETPGSIHEGGELGYSLSHAYGAAFDNPDLTVFCVIGDGEAETGPLATAWHGNKFLNPVTDGTVLPILHLNGWKIANPTVLARIPEEELRDLMRGNGYEPIMVEFEASDESASVHERFAEVVDLALDRIAEIRDAARSGETARPRWPMIVLRSPKGWTGPKEVGGLPVEGTWRAHQVPLPDARKPEQLAQLEEWMHSYRPNELFSGDGVPASLITSLAPEGERRMSATPVANGGLLREDLDLPDFRDFAVAVERPGGSDSSATTVLGDYLAEVIRRNPRSFRLFGPDETASNKLAPPVYEATEKQWTAEFGPLDEHLQRAGRVMEVLSEHQCQGWLEGYLLTGRHGMFASYEAFVHIVDSMFNQHAKWLEASANIPWREPISSLNYLLSSHVWQQDHNGFTHQDPGFLDVVVNKSADVVRVYLPFDANTLLSTYAHCLQSKGYVNVVVAGKHPSPQWLSATEAADHCRRGLGVFEWAGNADSGEKPDVVLAAAGDVPTVEVIAAAEILREEATDLRVRVVNVVDLMRMTSESEHPHGLSDDDFDAIFTADSPVIFAFHGYPWLIHRLAYRRRVHPHLHVRGYKERGTTTTPFDMLMLNDLDRFQLAVDALDRIPGAADTYARLRADLVERRTAARQYTRDHGEDDPAIAQWRFSEAR
ncbi:xylulose-5-phosphate/fructose-6-phosphate phosphoketolase [Microbacterium halimionae]|uniref:Probable phosphoketolase n=1 Tax=Microbacterium halimionae TaxID=1526413 RepID=A0A7W3JQN1_9MICO|nr:phosphoketolase family protein [Microbacterium halimionae]MBA8817220.1 xylulose-5-phosphate/fructose-6-phosphate phosphoketolase [Microbacterium halimionae]NII94670.1 xylulose-5-phosphate/fructose-6-phosphate phosphoketolase [Microbacterium halimionae]